MNYILKHEEEIKRQELHGNAECRWLVECIVNNCVAREKGLIYQEMKLER